MNAIRLGGGAANAGKRKASPIGENGKKRGVGALDKK